jgi:hypothetical protein
MKRIILIVFLLNCFSTGDAIAQRKKGESVLSLGMGLSVFNIIVGSAGVDDSVTTFSTPTLYATYDYALSRRFSLGLSLAHNRFSISRPYYSFINSNGQLVYDPLTYQGDRINLTFRPLFHWGSNEYIDWYTGFRIGMSIWNEKIVTRDPFYKNEISQTNGFSLQALIGARIKLTELLSFSFDFGLGEPYLGSMGIGVKL